MFETSFFSAPGRERRIVMCVSVFVCLCVSVREHILGTSCLIFTKFPEHRPAYIGLHRPVYDDTTRYDELF